MKICPRCNAQLPDEAEFCTNCGVQFAPNPQAAPVYAAPTDPYDHTAEFDAKDISDNKVLAMLVYLMGILGVIVAALMSSQSKYVAFHVRNSMKFTVCSILLCFCAIIPILGWIVMGVGMLIILVLEIIAFIQVCKGQAKDPAIIRELKFLK